MSTTDRHSIFTRTKFDSPRDTKNYDSSRLTRADLSHGCKHSVGTGPSGPVLYQARVLKKSQLSALALSVSGIAYAAPPASPSFDPPDHA